jgi:hypothetical protein
LCSLVLEVETRSHEAQRIGSIVVPDLGGLVASCFDHRAHVMPEASSDRSIPHFDRPTRTLSQLAALMTRFDPAG